MKMCFIKMSFNVNLSIMSWIKGITYSFTYKHQQAQLQGNHGESGNPSQGAWRLALPEPAIRLEKPIPDGNPKPRKSSAVRVVIDPERMKGIKVMVATIAFGRYVETLFFGDSSPVHGQPLHIPGCVLLKIRRVPTPTSPIQHEEQHNLVTATRSLVRQNLKDNQQNKTGSPDQISMKRCPRISTRPPKYPCTAPSRNPTMELKMVSTSPNKTEIRKTLNQTRYPHHAPDHQSPASFRERGAEGAAEGKSIVASNRKL
jgi:hypothetical protein